MTSTTAHITGGLTLQSAISSVEVDRDQRVAAPPIIACGGIDEIIEASFS